MRGKEPRERSVSGDLDDSDFESHNGDGSNPPGKPGRKKNPNSQAARRDQNRIAQREFRLRKQQRIRDLEARVEILSGGKDEALGEMRNILKDLMTENQTLRNLLRSLASFIGDGAGGLLPKLGWDIADFNNYINRSETDTAWESYQQRKKQTTEPGSSINKKRPAEDDAAGTHSKKSRGGDSEGEQRFPLLISADTPPLPSNGIYHRSSRAEEGGGMFADLLRNSGNSPMFIQQSSTSATPPSYPESTVGSYPTSYIPGVGVNIESPLPLSYSSANATNTSSQQQADDEPLEDDDPNKNEAYKLIHYHLENFKRNPAYCLPASLRPTVVQRTIPHESVIDAILHSELRDRMILLRNRYDLVECLMNYREAVTIHGDDVLGHTNWEIGEMFLRKYGFLIDKATLGVTNRWRRERGEPELRLSDIGSSEHAPLG
ncbi:hypothetical protein BDZ94DRAFT_1245276 [Collybia nuda]|uniref:BZIP domain-containing protein n=1 Tax=Collybia nuda TaxID=64659 RepID=A0A9P5YHF9_9AGAR|nr:hypothetical protein BDZ94DRAFT_1245276 [Collybia nuda]